MKEITEDKGRVRPVVEGDFQCDENGNSTRFYEILSLVGYIKDDGTKIGYISKTDVPIGIPITDTEYWYPFQIIAVPKGDKGDDGKSAYELYIEHGGTIAPVEAWLASLQGKDGKDGQPLMLRVTPDGQSLEISDDGGHTWYMFEKNFSKLRVLGYLNSVSELPRNADIGDIYGVKLPNEEVEPGHSAYELWINTVKGWNEDYVITKIYDYDTELPSYAAEGSTVVVPVKYLTLDKQKVDGYKVYRFDQAKNGWIMILNTAEIFASKEDIVNHGDNVYALVQGDSKKTYHDITNWINGSLDENNKYQEDLTSIIGTCPIDGSVRELSYNIANGYKADIRILSDIQPNPIDIDNPTIVYDTEIVEGTGSITIPSSAKSIIVTMKSVNEEEEIPTSAGTMISMYSVKEEKIILYKRNTGWVYFGTNASITYILIQDVEEGTSTNILSGEAVKLKFAEFAAALDAFKQEIKDTYGDYEENSEFVRVTLDHDNKVLYGVQADGNFYFGGGCPQQVKDYIEKKIKDLSLDEYESIVSFLNNLEFGDKTLQDLFDEKVDKEEGKSLIDKDFADGVYYEENPEFAEVKLDNNNRIIEATYKDGKKLANAGLKVKGDVELDLSNITTIKNPEFSIIWLSADRIIFGIQKTGNFYFGAGVPNQIKDYVDKKISNILGDGDTTTIIDTLKEITAFLNGFVSGTNLLDYLNNTYGYYTLNPEYAKVYLDDNDKIIKAIKNDGFIVLGVGYELCNSITTVIENPEFAAVYYDALDHILFGIKQDGDIIFGCGVPKQIQTYVESVVKVAIDSIKDGVGTYTDNPEYIEIVLDNVNKLLEGRTLNGTKVEKVGFITPNISIDGHTVKNIEDVEKRSEIVTDSEGKIISYRDTDGVKHENVGIETDKLILTKKGLQDLQNDLNKANDVSIIDYNIPKYGTVNIKTETFYLSADGWNSYADDVELRQLYDDTDANALKRITISRFFIRNTNTPLLFFAASKVTTENNTFIGTISVTKVNGVCYYTDTLALNPETGLYEVIAHSIQATVQDEPAEQKSVNVTMTVKQVTDVPPYKAWPVEKKTEHYCIVAINFGYYYKNNNAAIGVKYQGSSTTANRKRNFRFTFYKNSTFAKKDKKKFGEMLRLSGFNLKSNWSDNSRVKELVLYRIILDIWLNRPIIDRFPWDNRCGFYTGATGTITGFPIKTLVGGEFYGMQVFFLKKDEKNYMLDGDDDASGIFVSGTLRSADCWTNAQPSDWEDEMEAVKPMSQETADALTTFFDFINNRLEVEGTPIPFDKNNIPERMDILGWIDYFICIQVFQMWDSTCRNLILHTQSDKKKFYPYFYDLDLSLNEAYNVDFWQSSSITWDISIWNNIKDKYWDEIVNRYCELRKLVLNTNHIKDVYHSLADEIPEEDYINERSRWGVSASRESFEFLIDLLNKRFVWLDENYFIV